MKRITGLQLAINLVAATALTVPPPELEPKPESPKGRKKSAPHTPAELKAAQAKPNCPKQARQTYDKSLKAVQHAGRHKDKGTPKGVPFKR